jgi:hypothetical protein
MLPFLPWTASLQAIRSEMANSLFDDDNFQMRIYLKQTVKFSSKFSLRSWDGCDDHQWILLFEVNG